VDQVIAFTDGAVRVILLKQEQLQVKLFIVSELLPAARKWKELYEL
jgi:hypothetical protein